MNKFKKIVLSFGVILMLAGTAGFAATKYLDDSRRLTPIVYANSAMLLELWDSYKLNNIEPGSNRTLDKSQNNITTSEGESYTMLRSVWMDDKDTFDKSWEFTKSNLQRPDDKLLSWKFGQRSDGTYGVLTEVGGNNTASDADVDTALSLLMAYSRWNQTSYLYQAHEMINSIWEEQVVMVNNKPVLTANDLEQFSQENVVVNPSYFSPYSFKLFSKVDPKHDWMGLVDNSYAILNDLSRNPLGSSYSNGLPPNWISMNRQTGAYIPTVSPNLDTNYGYDAMRIPFRLALDYSWYKDPRAKEVMSNFVFLKQEWERDKDLEAVYSHEGKVVGDYEVPAMYGGAIGYFNVMEPDLADDVYEQKLQTLYSPDKQQWKIPLSYFDDNWAWFGIALSQDELPNLAEINN